MRKLNIEGSAVEISVNIYQYTHKGINDGVSLQNVLPTSMPSIDQLNDFGDNSFTG